MTLAPPRPPTSTRTPRWASARTLVGSRQAAIAYTGAVLLLWLLLPPSNAGIQSVGAWADQSVFGRAAAQVIATGSSPLSEQGYVGPAYLAAFRALRQLTSSDIPSGLVLLSRLSFVAIFLILFSAAFRHAAPGTGLRDYRPHAPVLLVLSGVVLLTPWRLLSDIPWTHFPASALVLCSVLGLRIWGRHLRLGSAIVGAGMILTLQTRMFEGRVLALALLLTGATHVFRRLCGRDLRFGVVGASAAWAACGAASAWLFVGLATRYWSLFSQYSGVWQSSDFALSPKGLPTRAAQMFLDPCFRSLCTINHYTPEGYTVSSLADYLRQPLLLQLPFLVSALAVLAVTVAVALYQRIHIPLDVQVAAVVAGGLLVGYSANPIAGAGHLRYGFVRDFVAPYVLLLYASARSTSTLTADRRVPRRTAVVVLAAAITGLIPGLALPSLGSASTVDYRAANVGCATNLTPGCRLVLQGIDSQGRHVPIGDQAVVVVVCGDVPAMTRIVRGRVDRDIVSAYETCGRRAQIQYLANSLGFYQTPEGEAMLTQHLLASKG